MTNYLQLLLRLKDLLHQGSMLRPTGLHRRHLFSGKQKNFNLFSNPEHTSTSGSGSNDIIGSLGASSIKNSSPSSSLASSLSRMTLATLIMMMIGMTTLIMTMVMTGMTMSMTSTPP